MHRSRTVGQLMCCVCSAESLNILRFNYQHRKTRKFSHENPNVWLKINIREFLQHRAPISAGLSTTYPFVFPTVPTRAPSHACAARAVLVHMSLQPPYGRIYKQRLHKHRFLCTFLHHSAGHGTWWWDLGQVDSNRTYLTKRV